MGFKRYIKKELGLNLPKPKQMREHIRALLLAASILTVAVVSLAVIYESISYSTSGSSILKGVVLAFFAVGVSVLAVCYTTIGLLGYSVRRKAKKTHKFYSFFGLDDVADNTIIVVPKFPLTGLDCKRQEIGPDGHSIKTIDQLDSKCIALDDLIAVRHINAAFSEFGIVPPKIFFDDDVWKVLYTAKVDESFNKDIDMAKNIIAVGLFSNCLTAMINESEERSSIRSFKLFRGPGGERKIDVAKIGQSLDEWRNNRNLWAMKDSDSEQFALLAKLKGPHGKTVFIVGGSSARGTRKIAGYFRRNWENIFEYKHSKDKEKIGEKEFSMQFSVLKEKGREVSRGQVYY